jgi:hypothetical protein
VFTNNDSRSALLQVKLSSVTMVPLFLSKWKFSIRLPKWSVHISFFQKVFGHVPDSDVAFSVLFFASLCLFALCLD